MTALTVRASDGHSLAASRYRVLQAADFGLPRIGHSGFFRKSGEAALWPLVAGWIKDSASVTMGHPPPSEPTWPS